MKQDAPEKKNWGKSVAIALAGSLLLTSATAALHEEEPAGGEAAKLAYGYDPDKPTTLIIDEEEDEERNKVKAQKETAEVKRSFLASVGIFFCSLFVKVGSVFVKGALGKVVGGAAMGVGGFFCDWFTNFFVIGALFAWLFKRLYPERKLKELFSRKGLAYVALGAMAMSLVGLGVSFVRGAWALPVMLLQCALYVAGALFLYYKVFDIGGGFGGVIGKVFGAKKGRFYLGIVVVFALASAVLRFLMSSVGLVGVYGDFVVFFMLCLFAARFFYQKYKPKAKEYLSENFYFRITEPEGEALPAPEV